MKTYMSILYFNTGINERINVGLIMFDEKHCMVEIKQSKMEFVKHFKPYAFKLFEYAATSFKNHYSKEMPTHKQIKRQSICNNGVFKLDSPMFIAVDFTSKLFNSFFDKHI